MAAASSNEGPPTGDTPIEVQPDNDTQPVANGPADGAAAVGGTVINLYDEQPTAPVVVPPVASRDDAPTIIAVTILVFLIVLPLFLEDNSRAVDLVALLCLAPAALLFEWSRETQTRFVALPVLLSKFVYSWLILFPCCVLVTIFMFMCLVSIVSVLAVVLGLGGLAGWMALLLLSLVFVATEETSKFWLILWKDNYRSVENPKQYVLFSLFTSLGLATAEAYYVSLFLRATLDGIFGGEQKVTLALFFLIVLCCCVVVIPMHLLSGYHIGLAIARRDVLHHEVAFATFMSQPVLFRFVFLYTTLFVPSIINSPWPLLLSLGCMGLYLWWVKRCERGMPHDYLARTGYLTAFGYGAIPEVDEPQARAPQGRPPPNDEATAAPTQPTVEAPQPPPADAPETDPRFTPL